MSASEFPLKKVPNPDDYTDEDVAAVADLMARTRKAVAPNPLAQALYPPVPPHKPRQR